MDIIPKKTIQEVICSTKFAWRNGIYYEMSIPNCIELKEKEVKVGFKNIYFPKKTLTVKYKIGVYHALEKVDLSKAQEFEVTYNSMNDLCHQLDASAYMSLGIESGGLDFTRDQYYNQEHSKFILGFSYEYCRVVLRKNIDYVVYVSESLDKVLNFGVPTQDEVAQDGTRFVKLQDYLTLGDYCSEMNSESEEIVHLVVYDMIESLTCGVNGSRYPVGCTFKVLHKGYGLNNFVSVKNVSVPCIKKVKCSFLNKNFENFNFNGFDLVNDPIMFTLFFIT